MNATPPHHGLLHRSRLARRTALCLIDAIVLAASLELAYQILMGSMRLALADEPIRLKEAITVYRHQFMAIAGPLVLARLALFGAMGLYRGMSRYVGLFEVVRVAAACLAGSAALAIFNLSTPFIKSLGFYPIHASGEHILRAPWGVVMIDAMASVAAIIGVRVARRIWLENATRWRSRGRQRVVILGAGDTGEQASREILRAQDGHYKLVAFLDPDPRLRGQRIHGVPVLGGFDMLPELAVRENLDLAILATPTGPRQLENLVADCSQTHLKFKMVPQLDSLLKGRVTVDALRPVEIEDLLGRPPIVLPRGDESSYLTGRRVLVTGAGGSIGSELCRQALGHRASELILIGRGENSIYEIQHELTDMAAGADAKLKIYIGDVRDEALMKRIFAECKPGIVMHAAAHKHVHLMEAQPAEAIKNNAAGTRIVAEAAIAAGAERFILISTDKAVHPRGAMGASKRLAEMIVTALNANSTGTRLMAVRFGNVLGSRGSVIPLFRRQIREGGPITITHPDIERYFMTIPEAVSLVIEAGKRGQGGEIFLLDMGRPVKIVDLARNLITLSGLEPGRDIEIKFTGLRPGEKMSEELYFDETRRTPTGHEKIFVSTEVPGAWTELAPKLAELERTVDDELTPAEIRAAIEAIIPEYEAMPE